MLAGLGALPIGDGTVHLMSLIVVSLADGLFELVEDLGCSLC